MKCINLLIYWPLCISASSGLKHYFIIIRPFIHKMYFSFCLFSPCMPSVYARMIWTGRDVPTPPKKPPNSGYSMYLMENFKKVQDVNPGVYYFWNTIPYVNRHICQIHVFTPWVEGYCCLLCQSIMSVSLSVYLSIQILCSQYLETMRDNCFIFSGRSTIFSGRSTLHSPCAL